MLSLGLGLSLSGLAAGGGGVPLVMPSGIGSYDGGGVSTFQTYLGRPTNVITTFIDRTSWATMASTSAARASDAIATGKDYCWSVPLVANGGSFAEVIAGTRDSVFTTIATNILSALPAGKKGIIRLGWEFNLSNWPWYAGSGNEAGYIAAFIRVVGLFKAISSRFVFDLCINTSSEGTVNLNTITDGLKTHIGIVGNDVYWSNGDNYDNDGAAPFGYQRTKDWGLDATRAFATANGLEYSIPEMGCRDNDGSGHSLIEFSRGLFNWIAANDVLYAAWWEGDHGLVSNRIGNGDNPLTAALFLSYFGAPAVTTAATAQIAGGDAFSIGLVQNHAAPLAIVSNADGFSLVGSTLSLPAQTYAPGGDNVRNVSIRVGPDQWGPDTTQFDFALTVTAPVVDLYPAYHFAFDPVNGFYKIGTFKTNTLADFLARPEVHFATNPTSAISASGFLPASNHDLYIDLPSGSAFSVYSEQDTPTHANGTYHQLFQMVRSSDGGTYADVARDGFQASPRYARSGVRDGYGNVGTDTNFYAFPASGSSKVGVTISGSAVKFFAASALRYTNTTAVFATKPLNRLWIGDRSGGAAWAALIKRVLVKTSTDTDSAANAATT